MKIYSALFLFFLFSAKLFAGDDSRKLKEFFKEQLGEKFQKNWYDSNKVILSRLIRDKKITPSTKFEDGEAVLSFILRKQKFASCFAAYINQAPQEVAEFLEKAQERGEKIHESYLDILKNPQKFLQKSLVRNLVGERIRLLEQAFFLIALKKTLNKEQLISYLQHAIWEHVHIKNLGTDMAAVKNHKHFHEKKFRLCMYYIRKAWSFQGDFYKILSTIDKILCQEDFSNKLTNQDIESIVFNYKNEDCHSKRKYKRQQGILTHNMRILLKLFEVHGIEIPDEFSTIDPTYRKRFRLLREKGIIGPRLKITLDNLETFEKTAEDFPSLDNESSKKMYLILSSNARQCQPFISESLNELIHSIDYNVMLQDFYNQKIEGIVPLELTFFDIFINKEKSANEKEVLESKSTQKEYVPKALSAEILSLEKKNREHLLKLAVSIFEGLLASLSKYYDEALPSDVFTNIATFKKLCDTCKRLLNMLIDKKAKEFFNRLTEEEKITFPENTIRTFICRIVQAPHLAQNYDTFLQSLIKDRTFQTPQEVQKFLKKYKGSAGYIDEALKATQLLNEFNDHLKQKFNFKNMSEKCKSAEKFHDEQVKRRYGYKIQFNHPSKNPKLPLTQSDLLPDVETPKIKPQKLCIIL